MLSGGLDKSYVNTPLVGDPVDCLSKRLEVVVELGIQGALQHNMYEELKDAVLKGVVSTKQLSWIYALEIPLYTKALGRNLSFVVVDAVISEEMTTIIPFVRSNHIFAAEISAALTARKGRLYAKQHHDWEPLSLFQLDFIYAFTKSGDEIRSMVVHDLIRLHYWQCVPNEQIYISYAEKNSEFNHDWERAEQERLERRANKKFKSRAVNATEQQLGAAPRKQETRSQRANKKYHNHLVASPASPSVLEAKDSTHLHTRSRADTSLPKSTTTRRRPHQRNKINGLSSKPGSMVPHTVNIDLQKSAEVKAQETNAKDQKQAEANVSAIKKTKTKEANSPSAVPPPGKRVESDAVLRLTTDGEVERER